jgi:formylglycine-generating enzyme required for sulfatase activity
MSQRKPAIFFSYTRSDDTYEDGALSTLRERLEKALRFSSGEAFDIFQDVEDIKLGQDIRQRIETSLDATMVFVPIITPSYLKSTWCREELECFLKREQQLGRRDLILPIYYQQVPALEGARQGPQAANTATDPLVRELAPRLSVDWRKLRRKEPESREVRMAVEDIAERIFEVLEEQKRREAEAAERKRQRQEAEEQERQRRAAEAAEQKRREEQERKRREAEEQERQRREAEEQERQRRAAEAAEQKHHEAEEQERQRRSRLPLVGGAVVVAVLLLALLAWNINGGLSAPVTNTPEPPTAEPTPLPATVETEVAPGVTMEFVEVPAGRFLMGSSDEDKPTDVDEHPQHELTLPTYYIGKTEVTNAQFRPFVEGDGYTNPAYWSDDGWAWREENNITQPSLWNDTEWNGNSQPVVGISWYEAVAYANWVSAQTGQEFRLPTEAEWEKAARGTDGQIYPWGNQAPDETRANFGKAVGHTTPVGSYPAGASPYGALDMAGNAWEWTATRWRKEYPYEVENEWTEGYLAGTDGRIARGGSWFNDQMYVRGANRNGIEDLGDRGNSNGSFGVRLSSHSLSSP